MQTKIAIALPVDTLMSLNRAFEVGIRTVMIEAAGSNSNTMRIFSEPLSYCEFL